MTTHGRHIKVLGRGNPSKLGDAKAVENMLVSLIDILGMRMLDKAHMYEVETEIAKLGMVPFEDEGGVTGVCVLSTSHCSIHNSHASVTVLLALARVWVPNETSCRALTDHASASFLVANVLSARFPLCSL